MNPKNIPLQGALLAAALLVLAPLAAQTGFSSIATSGSSPLLNDARTGEPGTIPAAPAAAFIPSAESSQHLPAGFVGRSAGPQPDLNADANAYRGLWEIHPQNSVTTPQGSATSRMEH